MKLEAFRVRNYKKIHDTGWVKVGPLAVLVGKNEAGKSAILRGLSKLNPSDGEKYDGLKEFPRRRYTDEFGDGSHWPVASARFSLADDEREQVIDICPPLADVQRVTVTRYYTDRLTVTFDPDPEVGRPTGAQVKKILEDTVGRVQDLSAPEGKGEELGEIKTRIIASLTAARDSVPEPPTIAHLEPVVNAFAGSANESWQQAILSNDLVALRNLSQQLASADQMQQARNWIAKEMPQFIYFDRYDVLESAIHIPTFVHQLSSTPNAPRVRTTHCLFRHVGLDVKQFAGLGRHEPGVQEDENVRRQIDQRAILASSASQAMTTKFSTWWEQRRHTFRYQFDGDYFRIWVSDDLDPSEIELDQRSQGMQYFFSFYLVFLVESEDAHAESILLLDEPALQLHGTAQAKVIEFLRKLSAENQTIYTTHSPFMVDADHLETVRPVYEDENGTTRVSDDVWPRDRDALFPLQAALGYQLAQSLFISKRQVLVEGITDMWLVKALDQVLRARGQVGLSPEIIVNPAAGVSRLMPLASMLISHDVNIVALLDGDEPARREGRRLVDKLLVGRENLCLFIGDFTSEEHAEVEDIFPQEMYLDSVKATHPGVQLKFNAEEKALPTIVDRVEALFRRRGAEFEKWRVAEHLRDRIIADPISVPDSTMHVFQRIAERINGLLA